MLKNTGQMEGGLYRMHGRVNRDNRIRVFLIISACLVLVLLLAGAYVQTDHEKEIMEELFFECTLSEQNIQLGLWQDEAEEVYYLFLPSALAGKNKEFAIRYEDRWGTLKIDGRSYKDGELFREAGNEEVHLMELQSPFGGSFMEKSFIVLASENLPAVMITVEDENDLLDMTEFSNKKYIETGHMVMIGEEGDIICTEELTRFKVRGNLTATLEKKPFTFSFSKPISLCGMEPAVKWNLLANATDGSYIRNKVVLDLANESIESFEPDGEFTELYLNGQYQGLYLLTEAVEIDENRIDIPSESSWLLEMNLDFRLEGDKPYIISERGQIFEIESMLIDSDEEKARIQNMINDIESALFAEDGISAISGKKLSELIDLESWAEVWLIQEISGDHDTGIASQFAYVPDIEVPLLYAGPVWDFDGTMGNVNTPMFKIPTALTTSIEESRPRGNANQNRWLSAMYRNDEFREVVEKKYETVFKKNLENIINGKIEDYIKRISRSAELDAFRWHEKRLSWIFVLPDDFMIPDENDYSRFAGLECNVNMVKDFLEKKEDFLDKLWIEHADFCVVKAENKSHALNQDYNQTLYFWVEKGKPIEGLSKYEIRDGQVFYYVDINTGEVVTDGTIIWEDLVLDAAWEWEGEP